MPRTPLRRPQSPGLDDWHPDYDAAAVARTRRMAGEHVAWDEDAALLLESYIDRPLSEHPSHIPRCTQDRPCTRNTCLRCVSRTADARTARDKAVLAIPDPSSLSCLSLSLPSAPNLARAWDDLHDMLHVPGVNAALRRASRGRLYAYGTTYDDITGLWHPHVHMVLVDGDAQRIARAWRSAARTRLGVDYAETSDERFGYDAASLARYLHRGQLDARESQTLTGLTPGDLARRPELRPAWLEYCAAAAVDRRLRPGGCLDRSRRSDAHLDNAAATAAVRQAIRNAGTSRSVHKPTPEVIEMTPAVVESAPDESTPEVIEMTPDLMDDSTPDETEHLHEKAEMIPDALDDAEPYPDGPPRFPTFQELMDCEGIEHDDIALEVLTDPRFRGARPVAYLGRRGGLTSRHMDMILDAYAAEQDAPGPEAA